jgi:hypothetical protein
MAAGRDSTAVGTAADAATAADMSCSASAAADMAGASPSAAATDVATTPATATPSAAAADELDIATKVGRGSDEGSCESASRQKQRAADERRCRE